GSAAADKASRSVDPPPPHPREPGRRSSRARCPGPAVPGCAAAAPAIIRGNHGTIPPALLVVPGAGVLASAAAVPRARFHRTWWATLRSEWPAELRYADCVRGSTREGERGTPETTRNPRRKETKREGDYPGQEGPSTAHLFSALFRC